MALRLGENYQKIPNLRLGFKKITTITKDNHFLLVFCKKK
jgi:hypothetical protein